MDLTVFKHPVVSRTADGDVLIALMDGEGSPKGGRCVGLISCRPQVAATMCAGVGSVLKEQGEQ